MVKICGVFNFAGQNALNVDINSGLKSQIRLKDEEISVFYEQNIGLGQLNSDQKIEYDLNGKSNHKLAIVADAVLTNRTELCRKFGVLFSEQRKFTDKYLILKSYEKWGENCVEYLVGDFAFAIWDKPNEKLFCCRDHFGVSPLFYYKDEEKFIFASEVNAIFSFYGIEKKLNKKKLGTYLLEEPHRYLADQSWFEDIYPFPAGTSLSITSDRIKKQKYWQPNNKITLPYKTDKDILEAFRELFFEIIESRINNHKPVASLLSGGLDSSSIVGVAAKTLEKRNKEINVFAGVLANENDEQFKDERYFIDQFKSFPNVKINYVTVPKAGPFSDLDAFFENRDSPIITSHHYLYTAFCREANKIEADTLFDGCFGEMGATSHSFGGFAEMFANLKWVALWRELKLRKQLYNDSIKYNIRANVINPFIPNFLINLRHGRFQNPIPFNKNHSIQKDLAESLVKDIDFSCYLYNRIKPNHRTNQLNDMIFLQEKLPDLTSSNFGIEPVELKYPLLDKRLIEFTLAVPLRLKFKDGYYRYLVRAALDNILPPKIQWRTTKTPFSPDFIRRFNSQINIVRELLDDIKPNDPIHDILDIEKLKNWANLLNNSTKGYSRDEMFANTHNTRAIYLIYFLRTFSEFRI